MCPIASWGNSDAARLDARAFYKTFNLYLRRVNEFRQLWGDPGPADTRTNSHPSSSASLFSSPTAREDVDEEEDLLEIVFPQAFANGRLLLLSLYFVKNMPFLSLKPRAGFCH
jgi:hypothetical protein